MNYFDHIVNNVIPDNSVGSFISSIPTLPDHFLYYRKTFTRNIPTFSWSNIKVNPSEEYRPVIPLDRTIFGFDLINKE